MQQLRRYALPAALTAAGLLLILYYLLQVSSPAEPAALPRPTITPDPIIPTRTPAAAAPSAEPTEPLSQPAAAPVGGVPSEAAAAAAESGTIPLLQRFGTAGALSTIPRAQAAGLPFGSFFNWQVHTVPFDIEGIAFWHTIRLRGDAVMTPWEDIAAAVAANPGAKWIVGNEPDVKWQDNVTPERYATLYHDVYQFIKSRDASAQLAIGAVAQPSPLRLAYLDIVLESYQQEYGERLPVDIWTVHAYILREEAGSWGVDIPPGMSGDLAIPYELEDHGDIEIFKANLRRFRAWMAANGYQQHPLAVTEFGIIMPPDYGFPASANAAFMRDSFDFMLSAADASGYAADGGRLVQYWFWFSVYDPMFTASDLYSPQTDELTAIGQAWAAYVDSLR